MRARSSSGSIGLPSRLDPALSTYRFAADGARWPLVARRSLLARGLATPAPGALTGFAVETIPGGGAPSAVKSDFCPASVFAAVAGATAGVLMT